jgi:hypothetical protein
MWKSIFLALKNLLTSGLSIAAVALAGFASGLTRELLRGKNYSDVGVPMYANNDISTLAGLLVFAIVLFGLLYALQKTISRNLPWLPYLVAIITCIFSSPILVLLLFW